MSWILEYFHELRKEKLRMMLTVLGVCWGMINIVLMLSVGEGLYRSFGRGLRGMGENIVVVWPGQTSKAYQGLPEGRRIRFTEADLRLIGSQVPEIAEITPEFTNWSVELRDGDRNLPTRVASVYPCYGQMRNMIPEPGGRFINELDMENKRRVIFIGNAVRDKLFGEGSNPVGKEITMNDIPFTVIGVMQEKIQMAAYSGMDEDRCVMPATTFSTMFNQPYPGNAVFKPRTPGESKVAQEKFRRVLAGRHRFNQEDEDAVRFWDTIEMFEVNRKVFRGIQVFLGIVGGLTLIIAGIGVANIMYVTVKERTREIGIKMAVGAHPGHIITQFVIEALLTVGLGGALGVLIGMGMVKGIQNLPIEHQVMEFLGHPVFSGLLALICTTILTFIGLLTGIFPANRASRVDPVEALRYE